jgi:hypothetical protein
MQVWAKALAIDSLLKPEIQKQRIRWSPHAHYGLGITDSVGTFLGHNGAIPGIQTLIGYEPQTGTTIVVFSSNRTRLSCCLAIRSLGLFRKRCFPDQFLDEPRRDACDEVAPSSSRRVRSVRHDARNPSRVQVVDRHARITPGLPARPS